MKLYNQKEVELLSRILSPDDFEREEAVLEASEASTKLVSRKVLRTIFRTAATDREKDVRDEAVMGLASVGTRDDAYAVIQCLDDPWEVVRASACSTIGTLLKKRARKYLVAALDDVEPVVRKYAAFQIAILDLSSTTQARLRRAWDEEVDDGPMVSVAFALAKLGDQRAIEKLYELAAGPNYHANNSSAECLQLLGLQVPESKFLNAKRLKKETCPEQESV